MAFGRLLLAGFLIDAVGLTRVFQIAIGIALFTLAIYRLVQHFGGSRSLDRAPVAAQRPDKQQ
jgi:hypothetical protein